MAANLEITKGLTAFDKRAEPMKLPRTAQVIHIGTACYILQQLLARQAVAHAFATGLAAAVDKFGAGLPAAEAIDSLRIRHAVSSGYKLRRRPSRS
jgi:hypothetical protein